MIYLLSTLNSLFIVGGRRKKISIKGIDFHKPLNYAAITCPGLFSIIVHVASIYLHTVCYDVVFEVYDIEPRLSKGTLYSMCCSICCHGELAINELVARVAQPLGLRFGISRVLNDWMAHFNTFSFNIQR